MWSTSLFNSKIQIKFFDGFSNILLSIERNLQQIILREDSQKKTADLVKMALLGGRGSEKLLNFHHLQMMKNMEGGGLRVTFHYFI